MVDDRLLIRPVLPAEYERVGDVTVAPAAQRLYPRVGFVRRPERDVHDFEAEHDMTFLAFTLDPATVTPAG